MGAGARVEVPGAPEAAHYVHAPLGVDGDGVAPAPGVELVGPHQVAVAVYPADEGVLVISLAILQNAALNRGVTEAWVEVHVAHEIARHPDISGRIHSQAHWS